MEISNDFNRIMEMNAEAFLALHGVELIKDGYGKKTNQIHNRTD